MEFIKAKEFLKQSVEVQKVFLDWWQPSFGDLFTTQKVYDEIDVIVDTTAHDIYGMNSTFKGNMYCSVDRSLVPFPLFSEGQLRMFIEDITGGKLRIIELDGANYNIVVEHKSFINMDSDLLQAYWNVALEIARECVENGRA